MNSCKQCHIHSVSTYDRCHDSARLFSGLFGKMDAELAAKPAIARPHSTLHAQGSQVSWHPQPSSLVK